MAYFRCSTGSASSGDGVALVVTCGRGFAGSVITATNGTDTFTETCPSVSPYTVRFEGIPTGTYTISGIAGGQTITTQFTVLDYETTLNAIPEGATVLPINDIQIWLHCANIWDKNYTTISQVLADTTTLLALVSSNNAADYMARSTSWASSVTANSNAMTYIGANNYCANKLLANSTWLNAICNSTYFESVLNVKVPTMTSNTTPSGVASATSYQSPFDAYNAFNPNTAYPSWYVPAGDTPNTRLSYRFTAPICAKKAICKFIYSSTYATSQRTLKIQASNDGTNWTDLASFTIGGPAGGDAVINEILNNSNKYYYYAIFSASALNVNNDVIYTTAIQFYGRA